MNRNQFQTGAVDAKDSFFIDDTHEKYVFNKQDDSDSGEDFDYGEEEEEMQEGAQDSNIDLMEYISSMDVSTIQGEQPQRKSVAAAPQRTPTDDFFNFGDSK